MQMMGAKRSNMHAMATLQELKSTLHSTTISTTPSLIKTLTDKEYRTAFEIIVRGSNYYQEFVVPQLTRLLASLLDSKDRISVLEIGPGPKSVLGGLPDHQRRKIDLYEAFEPNRFFAESLEAWLLVDAKGQSRFPSLRNPPKIHRLPFDPQHSASDDSTDDLHDGNRGYDVIIFCHSMYGMPSKKSVIEKTLSLLGDKGDEVLVVYHRDESLNLDGLVCHQTASFPTGVVRVADDDQVLDNFAPFIAGFKMRDEEVHKAAQVKWRKVCRDVGFREELYPDCLSFSSPNVMKVLTRHANEVSKLTPQLLASSESRNIKNRDARLRRPAAICRPTEIKQI
jgi:hypothetical protein